MSVEMLATFDFDAPRQREFARLSGDWNPIHVDHLHARRTPAGSLVVHGVHSVCRCLEALAENYERLPNIARLAVRFAKPTFVGDRITIVLAERTDSQIRVQACVGDTVTTQLTLHRTGGMTELPALPADPIRFDRPAPRERSFREIAAAKGTVGSAATSDEIRTHFAAASNWIGSARLSALLCISRIVGMECPGLYSLLASFDLEFGETPSDSNMSYKVVKGDERFRRVKMAVEGFGVRGTVDAFMRHPPTRQLSFLEVATRLKRNEFAGQPALVVGGSRGLGELTSKIIAAGGGHPVLTYSVGEEDAKRVQAEITAGGGICNVLQYDVRLPARTQVEQLARPVQYLYYYATCPIFRRKTEVCEARLLDEFLQFYVHGFQELCLALMPQAQGQLSVYCPSSSSVLLNDRPRGVTEYAMVKAGCEVLCEDLMREIPGLKILSSRLPRLETDQTSSFVPAKLPNALEILLPVIREVQSRGLSA